MGLENVQSL